MTTWALDLQARIGQRVLPTYVIDNALDTRFRVVHADTLREALDIGRFQANAINKLQCVLVGGEAVFSDQELDWLIDNDHYPLDVVSIPNPTRCGAQKPIGCAFKSAAQNTAGSCSLIQADE